MIAFLLMAATPPPSISTDTVLTSAIAAAIGAVLVAVVNGYVQRRKMGADATELITRAAAGVVATVQSDNARLREDRAVDHKALRELEEWRDAWRVWFTAYQRLLRDTFELHVQFDQELVRRLAAHGETNLPDPPPLPTMPAPPPGL